VTLAKKRRALITSAKLNVFVVSDARDEADTPLVRPTDRESLSRMIEMDEAQTEIILRVDGATFEGDDLSPRRCVVSILNDSSRRESVHVLRST